MYEDKMINARESDIFPGDLVSQRREKTGKMDNTFIPESFQVAEETGRKVTAESQKGATYRDLAVPTAGLIG